MKDNLRAFCSFCQCERTFAKRPIDHQFHAIVTALTLGLWAVGWVLFAIRQRRRSLRCRCCYHRLRFDGGISGAPSYPSYAAAGGEKEQR